MSFISPRLCTREGVLKLSTHFLQYARETHFSKICKLNPLSACAQFCSCDWLVWKGSFRQLQRHHEPSEWLRKTAFHIANPEINLQNDWDPQDKPSTWSPSNATARERVPPNGTLTGTEYTITTDLVLSESPSATWRGYEHPVGKPPTGDCLATNEYSLLHLPDGLSICYPTRVRRGMGAFQMSVHWRMDDRTVRQETVVYGADGAFECFRMAHYTR